MEINQDKLKAAIKSVLSDLDRFNYESRTCALETENAKGEPVQVHIKATSDVFSFIDEPNLNHAAISQ